MTPDFVVHPAGLSLGEGEKFLLKICGMPYGSGWCITFSFAEQGYISAEELLNIPELSINPLTRRLERMFDSVNFKVGASPSL